MRTDPEHLAQEDVQASELFCRLARTGVARTTDPSHESPQPVTVRLQQQAELRIVAENPFVLRVDAYDKAKGREVTYYLTQARTSLTDQFPQLITWTAPLSQLRHGSVGETVEVRVPAGDREYVIRAKGRYGQSAPIPKNVLYNIGNQQVRIPDLADFLRAKRTALAPTVPTPSPIPLVSTDVVPKPVSPREFGLSQIIFQTDKTQDSALRFPMSGHVLIEGAPGSGKTTVALQRIPYLLDQQYESLDLPKERAYFSEDSTIVFVLSEVLDQYLESLLSDLRVRVSIRPISAFLQQEVRSRAVLTGTHPRLRGETPEELILKTKAEVLEWLRKAAADVILGELQVAIARITKQLEKVLPGAAFRALRVEVLQPITDMQRSLTPKNLSIARSMSEVHDILDDWRSRRVALDATEREQVLKVFTDALNSVGEPLTILSTFLASDKAEVYAKATAIREGRRSSAAYIKALGSWRKAVKAHRLSSHDFSLLAWLTHWRSINGFDRSHKGLLWARAWPTFRHIVIDEAQDLSEVECRFLLELVDRRFNCVTAVGDLAQRINWPVGLESWELGGFQVTGQNGRREVFKVNYRQTKQIARCAFEFHRLAFGHSPLFELSPKEGRRMPRLHAATASKRRFAIAAEEVVSMLEDVPGRTVAILIDDDDERKAAYRFLKKALHGVAECRMSHATDLKRTGFVHITTTRDVKGLEFDAVVVFVTKSDGAKQVSGSRNLQYVAITRACEDLAVIVPRTSGVWKELGSVFEFVNSGLNSKTKQRAKTRKTKTPSTKR